MRQMPREFQPKWAGETDNVPPLSFILDFLADFEYLLAA